MTTPSESDHQHRLRDIAATIQTAIDNRATFLPESALLELAKAAMSNEDLGIRGRIIEAGVALGGSAMVLTASKSVERPISLYDTFGLIPAPTDNDGPDVHARYQVIVAGRAKGFSGDKYYGYRDDLLETIVALFRRANLDPAQNLVSFHAGDLLRTMTTEEPVSLVHIDCDWYEPVLHCLETFGPNMSPGGRFVVDDYNAWSGARRATDKWLAANTGFSTELRAGRLHIVKEVQVAEGPGPLAAPRHPAQNPAPTPPFPGQKRAWHLLHITEESVVATHAALRIFLAADKSDLIYVQGPEGSRDKLRKRLGEGEVDPRIHLSMGDHDELGTPRSELFFTSDFSEQLMELADWAAFINQPFTRDVMHVDTPSGT